MKFLSKKRHAVDDPVEFHNFKVEFRETQIKR